MQTINQTIADLEAKLAAFVAEREKLEQQVEDLANAETSLQNAIAELSEVTEDLRNK